MNTSHSSSLFKQTDPLFQYIQSNQLLPHSLSQSLLKLEHSDAHDLTYRLHEIYTEIDEEKWLSAITTLLYHQNETYNLQSPNPIQFTFLPTPGTNHAQLLQNDTLRYASSLSHYLQRVPTALHRELAWFLPSKHNACAVPRDILLILTFDPFQHIQYRTQTATNQASNTYWQEALQSAHPNQHFQQLTILHALTPIADWMRHLLHRFQLTPPPSTTWRRHHLDHKDILTASNEQLELYYQNSSCAYAFSTHEQTTSKQRSTLRVQQALSKKLFLFDSIYPSQPKESTPPTYTEAAPKTEETETQKTARAFWNHTIQTAFQTGASDIHLIPKPIPNSFQCSIVTLLRQNGYLNFHSHIPHTHSEEFYRYALENAQLVRDEVKRPQPGRRTWIDPKTHKAIDLRIETIPAGTSLPKVVMRLLDSSRLKHGIADLNLPKQATELWEKALHMENSLVVICGSTGSGKSTTLYAAMQTLYQNDPHRSFATIEDPIEYRLPFLATQTPVHPESNYATLIRANLRTDGQILLIGEVRDTESVTAAIEAAQTGHQVLTSLHASSTLDAITRLHAKGADPITLSENLKLVIYQTLIPTPCPHCTQPLQAHETHTILRDCGSLSIIHTHEDSWKAAFNTDPRFLDTSGCTECKFTGTKGVIPAQEFLVIDPKTKGALLKPDLPTLRQAMLEREHYPIEITAWQYAWLGKISINEAKAFTNTLQTR